MLAKAIGAVSIVAWFGVLFWGRMLPFVGNAFDVLIGLIYRPSSAE